MAALTPMPSQPTDQDTDDAPQQDLAGLLRKLADDGVRWASSELALARAEGGGFLRRCLIAIALVFASFAVLLAAIVILAEALVAALATYMNGEGYAGLAVGLAMIVLVVIMGLIARNLVLHGRRPKSLPFRWLASQERERSSK